MTKTLRQPVSSYQAPILWSVTMGTLLTFGFYGLLAYGPVSLPLLERYAKCHAVAYATVELFFVALCALVYKGIEAYRQESLMRKCRYAIDEVQIARSDETESDAVTQIQWLEAAWKSQPSSIYSSWIGVRVRDILASQTRRKSISHLDEDVRIASERDADNQHDSYALVRIVTWAMPMLGFLGTVIGISDTLGQMDAAALASGSQEAMNSLTAGLYVAFDTTAIGLVLTMAVMFVQFAVNKSELRLLSSIDSLVSELFTTCLVSKVETPDLANVEASLQTIGEGILQSMERLVGKQAELWHESMQAAETRWQDLSALSSVQLQEALKDSIVAAMQMLQKPLVDHHERIAQLHTEGAAMVDQRLHQWQITISDQARALVEQQRELSQQTDLLNQLIDKSDLVKTLEAPLQSTLKRMTDVDRFHDAAICLTEAVAVLGTQMERYGYLGRQPVRRRSESGPENKTTHQNLTENEDRSDPVTLPIKRKAG